MGKKMKKTKDMKARDMIRNTELTKPYVDPKTGKVFWGRTVAFNNNAEKKNEQ